MTTAPLLTPPLLTHPDELTDHATDHESLASVTRHQSWRTVVHDDPVNTMTYVVWVFIRYFGMSRSAATARMLEVHHTGRSVVSRGPRERMETDVTAMHGFGLRATIEPDRAGDDGDDKEQEE